MASTPGKQTRFIQRNDRYQDVTLIPGIGKINGEKLRNAGCYTADDVLNKFLGFGKSEEKFLEWLVLLGVTNAEHKRDCYRAIKKMAEST